MKIIGTLISLILLFTSCEDGLKEKVEKEIITKINNPKSYEFVKLNIIDSISNHKHYEEIIDSLTTEINMNCYSLLETFYDMKHINERRKMDSFSDKIRLLNKKIVKDSEANFNKNYKKINLIEKEYNILRSNYVYQKELRYFGIDNFSTALDAKTIVWDSLIRMDKKKLNYYFSASQPLLYQRYGIKKNDSIIKTFKFVDSIQKSLKNDKPITEFYIFEFSFREKNIYNAIVLSKKKIKTFKNKKDICEIYD